jgi:mannopine transport system ATP-binding protein
VSLLGPSGSGKTTLLMMIAGFESPSSGRILLGARDLTPVPPNKRGVGMVFQRYALFPHLTVEQNVAFPLRLRRLRRAEIAERVRSALGLVRLQDYGARMPSQLSGGQQQRVAVARALVFEPPVLLMDEPLGALDKKLREQMQLEIKRLHDALGVTVVYVTHDQEEALTMSDRVAVLSNGRLDQVGRPKELYDAPRNAFVADFIGKNNFIDGTCIDRAGSWYRIAAGDAVILRLPSERIVGAKDLATGVAVRLALRPESLCLAERGTAGTDALPGVIETAIFVGSFQVFIVRVGGTELEVHIPANAADPGWAAGRAVDVVYAPGRLHAFVQAA